MSEAVLFDVGHGNCTMVRSDSEVAIIDAPIGALLVNTLEDFGISKIKAAFISHADKDHIAGILSLLTSNFIHVEKLYINPDSQKNTKVWRELLLAVSYASKSGDCEVITTLTSTMPGCVRVGSVRIDVEGPSPSLVLAGSGSADSIGRTITSNSISAVLAVSEEKKPRLLLTGDLDQIGFDDLLQHDRNLDAESLVLPHHGGLPGGSNAAAFTTDLLKAVSPSFVAVSHGRNKHTNPKPSVISAAKNHGCSIGCTQMSLACHSVPIFSDDHIEEIRSHGRDTGSMCAGSMTIDLAEAGKRKSSHHEAHQQHIDRTVETPLCR